MSNRWNIPAWAAALWTLGAAGPARGENDFFEARIRPVLAEHCYSCHSASAEKLKGGLRVDGRAELLQGGESGPAIEPGEPGSSLLIAAMAHRGRELAMPPKQARLSDRIIADFEKWIREGAAWPASDATPEPAKREAFDLEARKRDQAWLWQAPRRRAIPAVRQADWPRSEEDFFILQRLEGAGLDPAPAADDPTWLRRAHFVITGLPPSREELSAFLADTSPGARERAAGRLLASPRFGERWARHWMDLMRYAETRGHEGDYHIANAWHYRDYLIRAFNQDVPYDQFVMEHIAGDLLLAPRLRPGREENESVLATGWAFLGEENHSPVDIRGDECERIDNKVDVFSKAFLGLTVACARCHDHKFDPIRAQDYYALSGFFLGSSYRQARFEAAQNNRQMAAELRHWRAQQGPRLLRQTAAALEAGIGQISTWLLLARAGALRGDPAAGPERAPGHGLPARDHGLHGGFSAERLRLWTAQLLEAATNQASPLHGFAAAAPAPEPAALQLAAETRLIADYSQPGRQPWKADGEAFGPGPLAPGDPVFSDDPARPVARIMRYGAARRDLFWNGLKAAPGNENDSGRLAATARAGRMLRTPTVTLASGRLHYLIQGKTRVYAAVDSHLMVEGPLHGVLVKTFESGPGPDPRWVTHDLSGYSGHRAHVEFGPEGDGDLEVLMVAEGPEPPRWTPPRFGPRAASPADWAREFQKAASAAHHDLAQGRVRPENALLADWLVQNLELFRDAPDAPRSAAGREFVEGQREIASRVRWESRTAPAWFDGTGVDEHVLIRGKPFKPGVAAPRSLPAAFALARPITPSESSGRLELGRQLIDPDNPLVARVLVNRVWHHLFGRGIVASVDNFGALGDRPTHPELLDHLAWRFVHEDGWSVKRLIQRLVLTQTFAMSSVPAEGPVRAPGLQRAPGRERDPSNLLLHRMPVRRLEGEAIRDALLAVSGRLNPSVGGAPEPLHLTEFLVGRGRPDKSGPLDGSGRRSVYLAMRRNFLSTFMQVFDAPVPFSTVGKRNVTNVPAQSLALMNDPLAHEQAGVWAARLFKETGGADAARRIAWLFESAFARPPAPAELEACLESLGELRNLSGEDSKQAWTELCHALLTANEFIYIR